MDAEKIIQDLNKRFAAPLPEFYKRRIIFWYDEDREFDDKAAGLREPEFIGGDVDLRINIYRNRSEANSTMNNANGDVNGTGMPDSADKVPNSADKMPDNTQERRIFKYVLEHGSITTAQAAEVLKVKDRRARTILMDMVEKAYLRKEGAARSTIYVQNTERE